MSHYLAQIETVSPTTEHRSPNTRPAYRPRTPQNAYGDGSRCVPERRFEDARNDIDVTRLGPHSSGWEDLHGCAELAFRSITVGLVS